MVSSGETCLGRVRCGSVNILPGDVRSVWELTRNQIVLTFPDIAGPGTALTRSGGCTDAALSSGRGCSGRAAQREAERCGWWTPRRVPSGCCWSAHLLPYACFWRAGLRGFELPRCGKMRSLLLCSCVLVFGFRSPLPISFCPPRPHLIRLRPCMT